MERDIALCATLMGGTRAMRDAGTAYLPKWPNEEQKAYDARLAVATLFPAYQRTVQTLTGKPFSKPMKLSDDMPAQIRTWVSEDVDLQGRKIDVFAADVLQEALALGSCGILVDYPTVDTAAVRTQAEEKAVGARPYMVHIHPQQILGWRAERLAGSWRFTQLRIMETVEEADGPFALKKVLQVRVLEPGKWATYRKTKSAVGEEWVPHKDGVTTLSAIPFVPVYGERVEFMISKPPLLEMAHMNVEHWQSYSDQQTILHVARVPILSVTGIDDDKWTLTVGASSAVKLPTGATMAYVEHTGAAIDAGKESLADLEDRMRQAGAELLIMRKQSSVTATEVAADNEVAMCALQRITQSVEDALDTALQFMADWVKLPAGGSVDIFSEFGALTMGEAQAQLLLQSAQAGKVSDETYFEELQRRGIVSEERTWADEKARMDEQGPAPGALTA